MARQAPPKEEIPLFVEVEFMQLWVRGTTYLRAPKMLLKKMPWASCCNERICMDSFSSPPWTFCVDDDSLKWTERGTSMTFLHDS